jgi:hypothetical protein
MLINVQLLVCHVCVCVCVTVYNKDMCSTSVLGTHKFMKLQFDSLEPRFAHFADGTGKLLKASLLLHQHKRKRYKRFVSKPSIIHLFLMVMAFPLSCGLMLTDFQPVNYREATGCGPMEGYTLHLPQSITLSSPANFPTTPPAIIFTHIMGVNTKNAVSRATSSLGWFKHVR